jgi:hypothetical protein
MDSGLMSMIKPPPTKVIFPCSGNSFESAHSRNPSNVAAEDGTQMGPPVSLFKNCKPENFAGPNKELLIIDIRFSSGNLKAAAKKAILPTRLF